MKNIIKKILTKNETDYRELKKGTEVLAPDEKFSLAKSMADPITKIWSLQADLKTSKRAFKLLKKEGVNNNYYTKYFLLQHKLTSWQNNCYQDKNEYKHMYFYNDKAISKILKLGSFDKHCTLKALHQDIQKHNISITIANLGTFYQIEFIKNNDALALQRSHVCFFIAWLLANDSTKIVEEMKKKILTKIALNHVYPYQKLIEKPDLTYYDDLNIAKREFDTSLLLDKLYEDVANELDLSQDVKNAIKKQVDALCEQQIKKIEKGLARKHNKEATYEADNCNDNQFRVRFFGRTITSSSSISSDDSDLSKYTDFSDQTQNSHSSASNSVEDTEVVSSYSNHSDIDLDENATLRMQVESHRKQADELEELILQAETEKRKYTDSDDSIKFFKNYTATLRRQLGSHLKQADELEALILQDEAEVLNHQKVHKLENNMPENNNNNNCDAEKQFSNSRKST